MQSRCRIIIGKKGRKEGRKEGTKEREGRKEGRNRGRERGRKVNRPKTSLVKPTHPLPYAELCPPKSYSLRLSYFKRWSSYHSPGKEKFALLQEPWDEGPGLPIYPAFDVSMKCLCTCHDLLMARVVLQELSVGAELLCRVTPMRKLSPRWVCGF